jgi:hypothetical protein
MPSSHTRLLTCPNAVYPAKHDGKHDSPSAKLTPEHEAAFANVSVVQDAGVGEAVGAAVGASVGLGVGCPRKRAYMKNLNPAFSIAAS